MYRIPHNKAITPKQFKDWIMKDQSPKTFVNLFHTAQGIGDIDTSVQRKNMEQGMVFQMLAHGKMYINPRALKHSAEFRKTLNEATEEEVEALVEMMLEDGRRVLPGMITNNRYHEVLRPWNIFNECDQDNSHTLDDKEVEILLWFQLRQRPSQEFVSSFAKFIDGDDDGEISRTEWTQAILASERLKRTGGRPADGLDDDAELTRSLTEDEKKEREVLQEDMKILLDMEEDPVVKDASIKENSSRRMSLTQAGHGGAQKHSGFYSQVSSYPEMVRA
jgi:hypothetical protein